LPRVSVSETAKLQSFGEVKSKKVGDHRCSFSEAMKQYVAHFPITYGSKSQQSRLVSIMLLLRELCNPA